MRKIYVTTAIICLGWTVKAQDSLRTVQLDEVVITGTRVETPLEQVDRSVTVISNEEIRKIPYQNVAEIISTFAPGVYFVGQQQNPGTNQSLFIRGTNSNHVNVLVNGVRLTDPTTPGASLDLSELSLLNVERIEILRGSHGAMYGSSGVGGVINIITKKGTKPGLEVQLDGQAGTFSDGATSFKQQLEGTYSLTNGVYLGLGLENWAVNGQDAVIDTVSASDFNKDEDGFEKLDFFGRVGFSGKKDELELFYKRTDQEVDIDDGIFANDENHVVNFERDFLSWRWMHDFEGIQVRYNGGYTRMERTIVDDSSLVAANTYDGSFVKTVNEGSSLTNELQVSKQAGDFELLVGLGHTVDKMNIEVSSFNSFFGLFESDLDSLDLNFRQQYVFGRAAYQFDQFRIAAGARITDHNAYGTQFSGDVNAAFVYNPRGKIYASLSTGFNNPSLFQLFDPLTGNEQLQPEKSNSFELGITHKIVDDLSISANFFSNRVKNTIEFVYLWDNSVPTSELTFSESRGSTYLNLSELNAMGFEGGLKYDGSRLKMSANYSYVSGEFTYASEDLEEEVNDSFHVQIFNNGEFLTSSAESALVRRPSSIVRFDGNYAITDHLVAGMNYTYVGGRQDVFYDFTLGPFGANNTLGIEDYGLFGLNVNYQMLDPLAVSFRIENLFDATYQEIQGFQTRGRGFFLRMNYQLGIK